MRVRGSKKILSLILSLIIILSLVACSENEEKKEEEKVVTAEELIDIISNPEEMTKSLVNGKCNISLDVDMDLDFKKLMLGSGFDEDDINSAIKDGELSKDELMQKIEFEMNIAVSYDKNIVNTTGSAKINAMGMNEKTNIKQYSLTEGSKVINYEYNEDDDTWYKSESDLGDKENWSSVVGKIKEYIKESKIINKDNGIYTLEATLDLSKVNSNKVNEFLSNNISGILQDNKVNLPSELKVNINVDYDKKILTGVSIDLADALKDIIKDYKVDDINYGECIKINKIYLSAQLSEQGEVKLEIPQEVIDNADEKFKIDWED